jgi:PPOX class probable F420-dependent enzyme
MASTFAQVVNAKDVLLTTFTKDGRPKPTAVWAGSDGDRLVMLTDENSWKVKRIRNTPRVTVAVCDGRGRPTCEPVEAVARILDKSEAAEVAHAVNQRPGLIGWLSKQYLKIRGLDSKYIPVEITPADPA